MIPDARRQIDKGQRESRANDLGRICTSLERNPRIAAASNFTAPVAGYNLGISTRRRP